MTIMSFVYNIPGVRLAQTKLNQLTSYIPPPPSDNPQPRRILLVHSHPTPDSFSRAIAETFEQSAIESGHEIKRINLCDNDNPSKCYRPNLSRKERESYFSFIGNKDIMDDKTERKMLSREVKTHLDLLRWCDTLVLVYPTWWMNTPASLKGFFDRTLVAGLTWEFPISQTLGAKLGLVPKLTNIERIVGISTYGASQAIVRVAGDNGRRMISNAIRHSVCPRATVTWMGLYGVDTMPVEGRIKFLEGVAQLPKEL